MTREEWLLAGGFLLETLGPYHFRAYEVADVGRVARDENGEPLATLEAPGPRQAEHAVLLIEQVLEWARALDGPAPMHVSSWYRDPAYNRAIGGADRSLHRDGAAADVTKEGWEPLRLARAIDTRHPESDRLGVGYYPPIRETRDGDEVLVRSGFVHVDVRGFIGRRAPARWSGRGAGRWWREGET